MHSFAIFKDREVFQKMARILKLGPKESKYMWIKMNDNTYIWLQETLEVFLAEKLFRVKVINGQFSLPKEGLTQQIQINLIITDLQVNLVMQ